MDRIGSGAALVCLALGACGGNDDVAADTPPAPSPPGVIDDGGGAPSPDAPPPGVDDASPPPPPANGLRAEYFDDFATSKLVRVDPELDFTWSAPPGAGLRAVSYSVRWTGTITPRFSETYTLTATSDDGVRVFIDDKPLIDDWTVHAAKDDAATVALVGGHAHAIRVEYFQYLQAARVALSWQSASQKKEIVPTAALAPAPTTLKDAPRPNYANPVVPFDCPDPGVLKVDGAPPTYYLVCTGGKFPIRTSNDLVTWTDANAFLLPSGAAPWAGDGFRNWAPEIHATPSQYVAYYTASDTSGRLCIGAAHAASPLGPWTHLTQPIVRDGSLGAIDATFFADDDGTPYLYWKLDGNAVGKPTPIFAQKLAPDGMAFAPGSTPHQVLVNDPATWEGGVVEAPWVVKRHGTYFLFYSGNVYDERYRTGVARATSPLGPFTKKGAPILGNDAQWVGPGHGSVVVAHGGDYFFHHAWPTNGAGVRNDGAGRWDLIDAIVYTGGWPSFAGSVSAAGLQAWP